jgi:hypothetical protein
LPRGISVALAADDLPSHHLSKSLKYLVEYDLFEDDPLTLQCLLYTSYTTRLGRSPPKPVPFQGDRKLFTAIASFLTRKNTLEDEELMKCDISNLIAAIEDMESSKVPENNQRQTRNGPRGRSQNVQQKTRCKHKAPSKKEAKHRQSRRSVDLRPQKKAMLGKR